MAIRIGKYQLELANKIRDGRAVGNEYVVTRRPIGRTAIIARFDTKAKAKRFMLESEKRDRKSNPGRKSIHTAKWDRCVKDVSARGGAKSAAAVCTAALGYEGSVKKEHRRKNPSVLKRKMTEKEMAAHIKETHPLGAKISADRKSITLDDGSRWVWDSRFEYWAMTFPPRSQNPLPSVRKVYYIICAHKGAEKYYLARSGKLTREQSSAARFPTAQAAIDKAKAHLKNYAASRKYRFDLKLAY